MNRTPAWILGTTIIAFILTAGVVFAQDGFRGGWHSGEMPWNLDDSDHHERMHRGGDVQDSVHRGMHGGRLHGRDARGQSDSTMMGRGNRGMHGGAMPGSDIAFDSEADYLAMMIPHHEEAVERARELRELTDDETMVELLENIIAEQTAEIEFMEGRLAEHYPDHEREREYEPMMRSYDGLDPEEAKQVFIEDMIPHHMHAIMSSRVLLRHYDDVSEETRELASGIIVSQRDEIHLMRDLYADLTPASRGRRTGMGHRGW